MTPGTPVRINYYGDIKHNAIGTVAGRREVGPAIEVTVDLHRPIRVSGHKPLRRVYVFERFLQELGELPAPPAEPQHQVRQFANEPKRARASQPTRPLPADAITLAKAGEILGVHKGTVNNLVNRGVLKGQKHGGRNTWYVRRSDVVRLAKTYKGGPGPRHSRGARNA